MPTKSLESAGVALDGKIYIIGGMTKKEGAVNRVEVYDPQKNQWNSASPLPEERDHPGAASFDGKIYVVGGFNITGHSSDSLFIYDPNTDKWEQGKNMPTPRGALTVKFVDGILYAIGGDGDVLFSGKMYHPQGIVNANEAYDPNTDSWNSKRPMPKPRDHLASAVVDKKIYVIGGRQPWGGPLWKDLNMNEMYDPKLDKWSTLEPLPTNRSGLSAALVDGKIYVLGGESIHKTFDSNEKYDPTNNTWTEQPPMPTSRHGFVAVAIDNKIYAIAGGSKPAGDGSSTNEIFHIN